MTLADDIAVLRQMVDYAPRPTSPLVEGRLNAITRVLDDLDRRLEAATEAAEACDGSCGIVSPCWNCGEYPLDEEE